VPAFGSAPLVPPLLPELVALWAKALEAKVSQSEADEVIVANRASLDESKRAIFTLHSRVTGFQRVCQASADFVFLGRLCGFLAILLESRDLILAARFL